MDMYLFLSLPTIISYTVTQLYTKNSENDIMLFYSDSIILYVKEK